MTIAFDVKKNYLQAKTVSININIMQGSLVILYLIRPTSINRGISVNFKYMRLHKSRYD